MRTGPAPYTDGLARRRQQQYFDLAGRTRQPGQFVEFCSAVLL
jgi:hypothetical protein